MFSSPFLTVVHMYIEYRYRIQIMWNVYEHDGYVVVVYRNFPITSGGYFGLFSIENMIYFVLLSLLLRRILF